MDELERSEKIEEAATLYLLRQSNERKPAGDRDGNDCWWPLDAERRACCQTHDERGVHVTGAIKAPTTGPIGLPAGSAQQRRYLAIAEYSSESLRRHCCSLKHVAHLLYLSDDERKAARARTRELTGGEPIKTWKYGPGPAEQGERARETVKVITW